MEANELAEKWIEARFDLDEEGKRIARKAFLAGYKAAQQGVQRMEQEGPENWWAWLRWWWSH